MADAASDANFLRLNMEWAQSENTLMRGQRLPVDEQLRRLSRAELRNSGVDISDLQAMHPLDSIAAGRFIQANTEVGTTYYFGSQSVNSSFGAQLNNELYRLGATRVGQEFTVQFVDFPSYDVEPPTAPPASSPNLKK
jgi:hypothetical protein